MDNEEANNKQVELEVEEGTKQKRRMRICNGKSLMKKMSELAPAFRGQTFYAHCFKLFALFVIALMHVIYMHPFLEVFSGVEDYAAIVHTRQMTIKDPAKELIHSASTKQLKEQFEALTHYKKNVWMTVAAMCVALSTSCFFLFLLPTATKNVKRSHYFLVAMTDIVAFASMPVLLLTRFFLVQDISTNLPGALRSSHKLVSAERLMNLLQCTVQPREKLLYCSDLIIRSIFPVILLKYFLILCVMTLAYLLVAYLIEYCIKHWFPPHGCQCGIADEDEEMWTGQREFNNKCYEPVMLWPGNLKHFGDHSQSLFFSIPTHRPVFTLPPNPLQMLPSPTQSELEAEKMEEPIDPK